MKGEMPVAEATERVSLTGAEGSHIPGRIPPIPSVVIAQSLVWEEIVSWLAAHVWNRNSGSRGLMSNGTLAVLARRVSKLVIFAVTVKLKSPNVALLFSGSDQPAAACGGIARG